MVIELQKKDIIKYNLKFKDIDYKNPVTIGNGDFALTLDQTGTQSLYEVYNDIPLTTMSNKHWFYKEKKEIRKTNVKGKYYMLYNLDNDPYYEIDRRYPHKYSFMQILLYDGDSLIKQDKIANINQELDLYYGVLKSSFYYDGIENKCESLIYQDHDELRFKYEGKNLKVVLKFNFPSYVKVGYRLDIIPKISLNNDLITIKYDEFNSLSFELKADANYHIKDNMLIFDKSSVSF